MSSRGMSVATRNPGYDILENGGVLSGNSISAFIIWSGYAEGRVWDLVDL
jgi:hypothetical protein